jgi:hypothetical protein
MAGHAGDGKASVETCPSIDVLDLQRRGYLQSAQCLSLAWNCDGELMASIDVRTESHCVILHYSSVSHDESLSNVEQRVAIVWTPCHFGGQRPFFLCSFDANGAQCGRQVSKLYGGGRLFACRHCYRLAYASQRETAGQRGRRKAQKIRMRLGGSPSMVDDFPDRPSREVCTSKLLSAGVVSTMLPNSARPTACSGSWNAWAVAYHAAHHESGCGP